MTGDAVQLEIHNTGAVDALVEAMGAKVEGGPLEVLSAHRLPGGQHAQVAVFPGLYIRVTPATAPTQGP